MKSKGPICVLSGPVPAVLLHQCLGQVSGGGFVPRELKDLQGFWLCFGPTQTVKGPVSPVKNPAAYPIFICFCECVH